MSERERIEPTCKQSLQVPVIAENATTERGRIEREIGALIRRYLESGESADYSEESRFVGGFVDLVLEERALEAEQSEWMTPGKCDERADELRAMKGKA